MDIQEIAAEYGVKNLRVFMPMRRLEFVGFIPGIAITSSSTEPDTVECEIVESRYKLADGYKVTFQALDKNYGREHFYQSDFNQFARDKPDRFRVFVLTIDGYTEVKVAY